MSDTRKILPYLRMPRSKREPAAGAWRASTICKLSGSWTARSAGLLIGVMAGAGLLENAGDDLVQRRILNAHVDDRVAIEDGAEHLAHAGALHLEIDHRPFAAGK